MSKKYDFSGWATRNDLLCSDGRTIRKDAFKNADGKTVPLVWNHEHSTPDAILGHALLENREEGVYMYGSFNDTESGQAAKKLVVHGDVRSISIFANKLKQTGSNVIHGAIREVSLVLAGGNPGAFIESIMAHSREGEETGIVFSYDENIMLHADTSGSTEKKEDTEETVADVFNTFSEKQKTVVYAIIGQALEGSEADSEDDNNDNSKGGNKMKHNAFDNEETQEEGVLSHSEIQEIFDDAKRYGSLKDSVIAHGIEDIDFLFPDAKNVTNTPQFIKRDTSWVGKFMSAVHKTPFSRIKSLLANITEDEARAKGYIKGNMKKEEFFTLLKRTTVPTTIYKKQKLDRDDVVDITDFDVVAWLKLEMRGMLDEEIARAALVGDGRPTSSDDKINTGNIRPIWTDDNIYTIKKIIEVAAGATEDQKAKAFIRAAIKSRKSYKGSGSPSLYTTEDVLTDCLLMEDTTGRVIYESAEKLATALRVKEIITVPVMEGLTRVDGAKEYELMGIVVNLTDYNIGADKGGAINMFDDFDIDYNQQKYLIETRCSGALIKPYSAISLELDISTQG